MWVQVDNYHLKNGEWTITTRRRATEKCGLFHGSINKGWYDNKAAAIEKHRELA